jgi:hypothetical protein
MPREQMSSKPERQMSRSDEPIESDEDFGRDEMGNSDIESGDLGKNTGMRPQGNGKEHPHGV